MTATELGHLEVSRRVLGEHAFHLKDKGMMCHGINWHRLVTYADSHECHKKVEAMRRIGSDGEDSGTASWEKDLLDHFFQHLQNYLLFLPYSVFYMHCTNRPSWLLSHLKNDIRKTMKSGG